MSVSPFHIEATNMLVMHNSNQINYNYLTYKINNCWCSVEDTFNELFIQTLLPSIFVFIIGQTYWLPFWQIETWPFVKAEPSHILALVAIIPWRVIYLAKWTIPPMILLFINQYSHATVHYSSIIFLLMKFLVKQHKQPGEIILTPSVRIFLVSHHSPYFHCINHHQPLFSIFL